MKIKSFWLLAGLWVVMQWMAQQPASNVLQNPWFADANCDGSVAGWTDRTGSNLRFGLSKKSSNPGVCNTAIRWHRIGMVPNVLAILEQTVPIESGYAFLSYNHVSLGDGVGHVNLFTRVDAADSWDLVHSSRWEGHNTGWLLRAPEAFQVPEGDTEMLVQITAIFFEDGGVKITGIQVWNGPPPPTATSTPTATPTNTPPTATATLTNTPFPTDHPTLTATPSSTATPTQSATPTTAATSTSFPTATASPTSTPGLEGGKINLYLPLVFIPGN